MQYAIIDESGRFADPKSRIICFAAVCAESLVGLDKIIPKIKRKIPFKGSRKREKFLAEIKFSRTGDKTKRAVLGEMAQREIEIFLLTIDTEGRKVADNPENYSLIIAKLLSVVRRKNLQLKHIIIDRHFTWTSQIERFNHLVCRKLGGELFIEHVDSQQNSVVSLADFVAGAVREYYEDKNEIWKPLIGKRIVYEKKVSWRELR